MRLKDNRLLLYNRKLYLTYGMVLCLVTLTDLQTRRAGLLASAELLVPHLGKVFSRDAWLAELFNRPHAVVAKTFL